jgi:hypothetical protein
MTGMHRGATGLRRGFLWPPESFRAPGTCSLASLGLEIRKVEPVQWRSNLSVQTGTILYDETGVVGGGKSPSMKVALVAVR